MVEKGSSPFECKHFGKCGSCVLYNIPYQEELKEKKRTVLSLLSQFGVKGMEVFSANQSNYRARAEFRIWHKNGIVSYGMGKMNGGGTITIEECPKVLKSIEKRMWVLIDTVNESPTLKERFFSIEFLATNTDQCLITMIYHRKLDEVWEREAKFLEEITNSYIIGRSRKQKVILTQEFVIQRLKIHNREYLYRYYENGFTQPNPAINQKMIEWTIEMIRDNKNKDFLEIYCGLGNFTIPLSSYFKNVLATEISKSSIKSANENCKLNNIENIQFVRLSSSEIREALDGKRKFRRLKDIDLNGYNFSTVLVDPPRMGLDQETIQLISKIENIIYISCHPHTLTRDLRELTKTHSIEKSAIFDQFPHTKHIESGVYLIRRKIDL